MTKTTQCPACQTRFKVSDTQLTAAKGLVRCGRCAHVFNAIDRLIAPAQAAAVAPPPSPPVATPPTPPVSPEQSVADIDDFELEVPDFDPMTASLPEPPQTDPVDAGAPSLADVEAFQQALNQALHQQPTVSAPIGDPFAEDDAEYEPQATISPIVDDDEVPAIFDSRRIVHPQEEVPHAPEAQIVAPPEPEPAEEAAPPFDPALGSEASPRKRPNPFVTVLVLLASFFALLLLAGQLIYINRTLITAQAPEARPMFERVCKQFGCTVPYSTDQEYIRTEWSELSFVPEHANLVQLSATLKNHAPYPQAFPMLEVTLKDADNQVLIRKVFTPREYLKPDSQKLKRFDARSEEKIVMRFDVGKVHAQGYSLYWFYP
ncbi:DUF3426 domain-containing protein [Paludibacterium purpuratum]|uniref:Putative Zn finger-like uncharacterized protein n=1 Tax=Paludibacterium purpuratum TaxID=1144873 RepID=A0A4R7AZV7_9NEIS|nr:DUF3426 domain-containing protein [Paludibacterium purpuratum]TDR73509.1 putative Zn finger-like uncharacterized protein [Paludibacterium purpuratum]